MHGIIMDLISRFVKESYGQKHWTELLDEAGLGMKHYHAFVQYEDDEAFALLDAGARLSGRPKRELLREFGKFIAPELIDMASILLNPEWKTMQVLQNAESILNRLMRQIWGVNVPLFRFEHSGLNRMTLVYGSKSKMCSIAKGVVEGVAKHFGENVIAIEEKCMALGAHECRINIQVVQARVPVHHRNTMRTYATM